MGAGEKRPSTTAISSTRIAIGRLFEGWEDFAGVVSRPSQLCVDQLASVVSRLLAVVEPNKIALVTHRIAAQLV